MAVGNQETDKVNQMIIETGQEGGSPRVLVGDEISQLSIAMAAESKVIKLAVHAKAGNALFDSLPRILETAPFDAKVEIILIGDKEEMLADPETLATMEKMREIAARKNKEHGSDVLSPEKAAEELKNVTLEIQGKPEFDNLTVFLQDPLNPRQYIFRKIGFRQTVEKIGEHEVPLLEFIHYPMPIFEANPCSQEHLKRALEMIIREEKKLSSKRKSSSLRATVAVARYAGDRILTTSSFLSLVALKYNSIREEYKKSKGFLLKNFLKKSRGFLIK